MFSKILHNSVLVYFDKTLKIQSFFIYFNCDLKILTLKELFFSEKSVHFKLINFNFIK